ncbi:MAG: RNA-binding S4 domain-containing protein [Acholeplasmatales bacterium]
MEHFEINGLFITLGQFLKAALIISSGGMIKHFLDENEVILNGVEEKRRGKKIYPGDILLVNGVKYLFL